jgi:hypothetical protein
MSSAGKEKASGGKRGGAKDPTEALRSDKRRRDMDDSDPEIDRCRASPHPFPPSPRYSALCPRPVSRRGSGPRERASEGFVAAPPILLSRATRRFASDFRAAEPILGRDSVDTDAM